eukprot:15458633-Alexandrium_andersonii.AAC.1
MALQRCYASSWLINALSLGPRRSRLIILSAIRFGRGFILKPRKYAFRRELPPLAGASFELGGEPLQEPPFQNEPAPELNSEPNCDLLLGVAKTFDFEL